MKYEEPEAMKEIHRIRYQMYEEMKDLSSEEFIKKIHEEAEACKKRFGLKLPKRDSGEK